MLCFALGVAFVANLSGWLNPGPNSTASPNDNGVDQVPGPHVVWERVCVLVAAFKLCPLRMLHTLPGPQCTAVESRIRSVEERLTSLATTAVDVTHLQDQMPALNRTVVGLQQANVSSEGPLVHHCNVVCCI